VGGEHADDREREREIPGPFAVFTATHLVDASHGGCVEVEAATGNTHPADDIMLALARPAAGRVG